MKIVRRGASADHGESSVVFKKTTVTWNEKENAVVVKSSAVSDFSTSSKHNYQVFIPLEDLAKTISALSEAGIASAPNEIEQALSRELKALVRLTAVASGLLKSEPNAKT